MVMVILFGFQHVISEPFEPPPFIPSATKAFDSELDFTTSQQQKGQTDMDAPSGLPTTTDRDTISRENNVAKIRVVVCSSCEGCFCVYSCACICVCLATMNFRSACKLSGSLCCMLLLGFSV